MVEQSEVAVDPSTSHRQTHLGHMWHAGCVGVMQRRQTRHAKLLVLRASKPQRNRNAQPVTSQACHASASNPALAPSLPPSADAALAAHQPYTPCNQNSTC
eukprot:1778534-Pleurochrysis_carterae.AAC.3